MSNVTIDRELLGRCRARLHGLMQADLSTELEAILAQHQRILAASVPAGCKVVPVELLERLEHVTRTLVPHLQCHVDLRGLLASAEGAENE